MSFDEPLLMAIFNNIDFVDKLVDKLFLVLITSCKSTIFLCRSCEEIEWDFFCVTKNSAYLRYIK